MTDLYVTAFAFRAAIEESIQSREIKKMASFPTGCCTIASNLLQRYFFEQGIMTWYISGQYGDGWDGESHAWLEIDNKIVIDITGDQYKHKKLRYTIPVYVGSRNDGFHDQFKLDEPVPYISEDGALVANQEFEHAYKTVLSHL